MKKLLIRNGTVVAENSEGLNEAVKCDVLCSECALPCGKNPTTKASGRVLNAILILSLQITARSFFPLKK